MLDLALDVGDASAGVALVPGAVERFRRGAKLHDEVAGNVLRLDLSRFSRHRRTRAASSEPMMIRASEPPMNARRSTNLRASSGFVAIWALPFMEICVRLGYGASLRLLA